MKAIFFIDNMMIRPYSPKSDFADGKYNMDMRCDFMRFPSYENIAVKFDVVLYNNDEVPDNGATVNLVVDLYDHDRETMIVAHRLKVHFSPWLSNQTVSIELPIDMDHIESGHEYSVRIMHGRKVIIEHLLRFYEPTFKREVFPNITRMYFCDGEKMPHKSIVWDCLDCATLYAEFTVSETSYTPIPEVCLALVDSECNEVVLAEFPEEVSSDDPDRTYGVTFTIRESMIKDLTYFRLEMLGRNLGCIASMETETPVEGIYESADLSDNRNRDDDWCQSFVDKHLLMQAAENDAREQLARMVGLDGVKAKVREYESLARFHAMRRSMGLSTQMPPLHSMFMGSPGTGKTTVAKIIGHLLHEAGVLSKGHVVVRERSTLLGRYYNMESENIREALEEAQGGVLFIDEAYQLYQPQDEKDPGRFVIETLLSALADESNRDWMLILAGYTEPMKRMFEMNPGLKSRIPESNFYYFEDYNADELYSIANSYISHNNYQLTAEAGHALKALLQSDYEHRNNTFGNARHVVNIIQANIVPSMALRLADCPSPSVDQLTTITVDDIPRAAHADRAPMRRIGYVA